MKVLGTEMFLYKSVIEALRTFGYVGHHAQIRIVCKCKSMADANRKCAAAGLGEKVFKSGWCSETGNSKAHAAVENCDIAFGIEQSGSTYITLEQVNEVIERSGSNAR